jgi:hypothetical protein
MSDTQVRAALGLLRKTIPDLAVTELLGDPDRPLKYEFIWGGATQPKPPVIEGEAVPESSSTDDAGISVTWAGDGK